MPQQFLLFKADLLMTMTTSLNTYFVAAFSDKLFRENGLPRLDLSYSG